MKFRPAVVAGLLLWSARGLAQQAAPGTQPEGTWGSRSGAETSPIWYTP